jgi:hypothetical protein
MENLEIYPVAAMSADLFPPQVSLAMLYVPSQRWEKLYSEEEALARGTLFRALDLPFLGGRNSR